MENGQTQGDTTLSTIEEIDEGDALYGEVSDSVFWVKEITEEYISLKNTDGEIRKIGRDAFQTTLHEHKWILQSKGPAVPLSIDEDFET